MLASPSRIRDRRNNMQHLSFETAYATLKALDEYMVADFDTLGITDTDFKLVHGNNPWRRDQIHRVMRTLNALIFGTLEVMGMPKIVVPAEYVACVVSAIVGPGNRMTACIWLSQERQTGVGALELAARGNQSTTLEPASADKLFALVMLLGNQQANTDARNNMMKKLGIAKENAEMNTTKRTRTNA